MRRFLSLTAILFLIFTACSDFEESADGRFEYGMELLKSGQKDKARELFAATDSLYPDSPYGQYGRAVLLTKERLDLEAAEQFLNLIEDYPDFLPGVRSFIDLAIRYGWPDMSQSLILNARRLGLEPNEGERLRTLAFLRHGNIDRTGKIIDSLIQSNPDNISLRLLVSEYSMHKGEFDHGIEIIHSLIPDITEDKHSLLEAGKVFALIGMADSAANYYNMARLKAGNDYYFKADIAQAYCDIGYLEDCESIISDLERQSPETYRLYLLKRNERLAAGRLFEALEIAMDAARLNNDIPTPHMNTGEIETMLIDKTHSRQSYQNAGQTAEVDSFHTFIIDEISISMIEAVLEQGGWTEALLLYGTHRDFLPRDFRTLRVYADIHFIAQQKEKAEEFIAELLPFVGDNAEHEAKLADLYLRQDMYKTALEFAEDALQHDAINALAIKTKAELLNETEGAKEALAFLDEIPAYGLTDPLVYQRKLELHGAAGEYESGANFINTLIEMGPEDIKRYKAALEYYKAVNDYEKGSALIEFCLERNPDSDEAQLMAADYYLRAGHPDKSREIAEQILKTEPSNYHAMLLTALALEQEGDFGKAIELYKRILTEDKMNGAAHGYLARALLESNGDMNEIMTHINQAVKFDKDPIHRITLARALMKQGQGRGAQRVLETAIKMTPESAELYYYAGMIARENNQNDAGSYLKTAIEKGLSDSLKAEAENILKNLK